MLALLKLDLQLGINLVMIAGFFLFEGYEFILDSAGKRTIGYILIEETRRDRG